ncbi:hypothetical protein O181_023920 [Austropuccinia psidii MF-1]|uniref:Uncharacterized protein n=1 Tax=Austropuccinia psidii MF-1 TaxID=1389203 RepID=A0A9Q3CJI4_9BASI|nr:hypothetical protein [Austropuccinia psidii MF-1]
MLVMLADKHTRNAHLLSNPSDHAARGVSNQDALMRTPLWSTMMKAFPSRNGHRDPKQGDRNGSGRLSQSPQVSICPPPLLGHYPMVSSLLDQSKVIIRPMKDDNGKRTFKLGPIVTMSCHPWDSNAKQPTPCPSGIQCWEVLFREPSRTNEPPIPGPSPSSEPHEDVLTREPEPELVPLHPTPSSSLTIHPLDPPLPVPPRTPPPPALIRKMSLAKNLPTYSQP